MAVTQEKKAMAYGLGSGATSAPQASTLKTSANPLNNLERNRIARNALYPTAETTERAVATDLAAKMGVSTTPGVTGAVTGAVAAITPATTSKAGSGSGGGRSVTPTPTLTNPYATQMQAAQNTMNQARPTYNNSYAGRIAELEASEPGGYTSQYQPNIDGLLNKLENREAFSYNPSEDPLYRQLVAKHMAAGRRAMQDTMGTAAGLTSGYGNSYASTAAGQAYQQHLNQLNDDAIDMYTLARGNYDAEGNEMRSTLSALQSAETMNRANYESDRADYYNRLAALREGQTMEYQQYMDQASMLDADQQRAWEQYKYWNDLWETKKAQ